MIHMRISLLLFAAAGFCLAADAPQALTGIVGDDMCNGDHKAMDGTDPVKCTAECIKSMHAKYALWVPQKGKPGPDVYVLSDQKTPQKYVGRKVTVTGTVTTQGTDKVLQVQSITPAN
jgi:hypothetical protein